MLLPDPVGDISLFGWIETAVLSFVAVCQELLKSVFPEYAPAYMVTSHKPTMNGLLAPAAWLFSIAESSCGEGCKLEKASMGDGVLNPLNGAP